MYEKMAKEITCATTVLDDPATAAAEIDRVLNTMMYESRAAYIGISTDIAYATVSDEQLGTTIVRSLPLNDAEMQGRVIVEIRDRMQTKSSPIIIVDGGAVRHQCTAEVDGLVEATKFPTFVTAMGKGAANETLPTYGGVYGGAGTHPDVKKAVEGADAVFWLGNYPLDFNTGEFTDNVKEEIIVDFQRFYVKIRSPKYDVEMKGVLQALVQDLQKSPLSRAAALKVPWNPYPLHGLKAEGKLTQDYLWTTLGSFFRSGDLVIGETGTSAFGLCDSKLPVDVTMWNQTVYGSIGYATGPSLAPLRLLRSLKESTREQSL